MKTNKGQLGGRKNTKLTSLFSAKYGIKELNWPFSRRSTTKNSPAMLYLPLNTTKSKCFIEPPIMSLDDGKNNLLALNIAANIVLMLTAIWGNVSILLSFAMVSSLRSMSNDLLLGLAVTDLAVGLVVHPLYILVLFCIYSNSSPQCNVMAAYSIATSLLSGVSLLYMTAIGIDRYLAITLHLRYHQLVTEKRVKIVQIAVWLITGLLSLVWLKGFRIYSAFAAVVVLFSFCTVSCVYIKIYRVVKKHKTQIHIQMESQMMHFEICRVRRLRKSAINTLYVFFVFALCYIPFSISTAITSISKTPNKASILAFELSATLMLSNSSLNPLMYCLRFREFRIAVKKTYSKILCCLISRSE